MEKKSEMLLPPHECLLDFEILRKVKGKNRELRESGKAKEKLQIILIQSLSMGHYMYQNKIIQTSCCTSNI